MVHRFTPKPPGVRYSFNPIENYASKLDHIESSLQIRSNKGVNSPNFIHKAHLLGGPGIFSKKKHLEKQLPDPLRAGPLPLAKTKPQKSQGGMIADG